MVGVVDRRAFPDKDPADARVELARLEGACGCEMGALAAVIGTAVYTVAVLLGWQPLAGHWGTVGLGVMVFVLSAVTGKAMGIGLARLRRVLLVRKLRRR